MLGVDVRVARRSPMVDTVLRKPAAPARPIARPTPIARLVRLVRRWIPKPLLLAVLGIGLSSWLLPAITRQWDDRQKAGELKAALVADMATATGRAVLEAQAFSHAPAGTRPSPAESAASVKEWSVAALEVRARLDAYFGPAAVDAWEVVTTYVNATLSRAYGGNAFIPGRLERSAPAPGRLQNLYGEYYSGDTGIEVLAGELLTQEERVARSILAMNVRGYSTTWDDVVSDLLPRV
jgi:hypothetical protein